MKCNVPVLGRVGHPHEGLVQLTSRFHPGSGFPLNLGESGLVLALPASLSHPEHCCSEQRGQG